MLCVKQIIFFLQLNAILKKNEIEELIDGEVRTNARKGQMRSLTD